MNIYLQEREIRIQEKKIDTREKQYLESIKDINNNTVYNFIIIIKTLQSLDNQNQTQKSKNNNNNNYYYLSFQSTSFFLA